MPSNTEKGKRAYLLSDVNGYIEPRQMTALSECRSVCAYMRCHVYASVTTDRCQHIHVLHVRSGTFRLWQDREWGCMDVVAHAVNIVEWVGCRAVATS